MTRRAALTFGLIISAMMISATTIAAPCPGASNPEVEACLKSDLDRSQADLKRYAAAATSRIRKEDTPQTLQAFENAQDAWSVYSDRECKGVYEAWGPGTIKGGMALICLRRLTEDRTHEIWRDWLTYMDSTPPILPEPPIHSGRS